MKGKKREPWRIVVAMIAAAYIIYMWVEKDIAMLSSSFNFDRSAPTSSSV